MDINRVHPYEASVEFEVPNQEAAMLHFKKQEDFTPIELMAF